jgi:hypothetical protein
MSVAAAINPVQASSENDVPEALLYYSSNGFLAMEHRPMDGGNYDSYSNNVPPEIVGPIKQPMQFAAVGHDKSVSKCLRAQHGDASEDSTMTNLVCLILGCCLWRTESLSRQDQREY